jgi:drug/metabolite transporter (DMT)-like permease
VKPALGLKMPAPVLLAGLLMAVSASISALDAVIVRFVAPEMHVFQITFWRNFFSLLALLPFLVRSGGLGFSSGYWGTHIIRAAIKLGAMIAYFFAILQLPLAVVMALAFTAPMFASAGGILLLGERATVTRVLSILAGLAGVVIVLRPGVLPFEAGALLALASAAGLGIVALLMKVSSGRESASRIVWLNLVLVVPMSLVLAVPVWSTPSMPILGLLVVQGVLGAVAQLAVARAMGMADAAAIVPVDFVRLPIVIFLGAVLFAEDTDWPVYVGSAVILGGILIQLRAERHRAQTVPVTPSQENMP